MSSGDLRLIRWASFCVIVACFVAGGALLWNQAQSNMCRMKGEAHVQIEHDVLGRDVGPEEQAAVQEVC